MDKETRRKDGVHMSIMETIDDFKREMFKMITDFSMIDENDPISSEQLSMLKEKLEDWISTIGESFGKLTKYNSKYEKKNQAHLLKYQQKIKILNDALNKNMKNITKDSIDACEKLKQRIEIAKKDTDYRIEQYEVELNYFLATSEQNKLILTNDYTEAKHRFDYQRDEAKESYLEIVKKNNDSLKKIKSQLTADYKTKINDLRLSQTEEVQKLKNYIEIQETELATITASLEEEKGNVKEKYRQESANLNEDIKRISDEKNKVIDKSREEYNKSINDANIEKENKKTVYQAQAQALLKEFVTKINIIDESISSIKKEFEKKAEQIKREYYTTSFHQTKDFHLQLAQIYEAAAVLDKYTNQLIHFKNKQHLNNIALLKKDRETILLNLTKDNTIKILSNRNDKNFLEIDKNFALKNITDQEQFDNKYYQENDNIYENDFNYTVKTANYRFSQQANLLRCQSQIRMKLLERNHDGISANYYKRIEGIQNKINTFKVTLDCTERLNQLINDYTKEKYKAQIHLEESNNLLEIEKNKLLKEFNHSQYEYNIKNITLAKEYGFKKIELENQKSEENEKLRVQLEKMILEKNCISYTYSIKREELSEHFTKIKTQVINNNDLKSSKENYITSLLENDTTYIEDIISSFTSFFNSYQNTYYDSIKLFIKDLEINEMNFHYLESFLNKFTELFLQLLNQVVENLSTTILDVLNSKMDYIYAFKYQSSLQTIDDQHNHDVTLLKENKNEILDKIDSGNKTIENFKQKIYTLINDSEMLLHNNQVKKKKNDSTSQAFLKQTDYKIRDYKEKIDDFIKMNKMYEDDLVELNSKLSKRNLEYRNALSNIEKMIRADMKIYVTFKAGITSLSDTIKEKISAFQENHLMHSTSSKHFLSQVKLVEKRISKLLNSTRGTLDKSFNTFKKTASNDISKRELNCTLEFKKDVKEFNVKYNKAILEYQDEYNETMIQHEKEIEEQTTLLNQMMELYDHKLSVLKGNFQNDINALDMLHNKIKNDFFISYYALDDNHQNIIQYHSKLNTDKDAKYFSDKTNLTKEKNEQINILNNKLKNFIKTKNEEIEHLPIAFKFNSKMLNKETKKKNIQLHEDIKKAKIDYNNQNKLIEKNIKGLKAQLSQDKFDNEYSQKRNIIKEKKNGVSALKQSLRNIKINL